MKELLFLTDFSDNAKRAIYYGLSLFKNMPANVHIIHTVYLPYSVPNSIASPVDVRTVKERESMEALLADIVNDFPDHQFEIKPYIMCGEISEVVKHLVTTEDIDLIIMGTHGVSGFAETFIGSNTTTVIREIDCAILAIPQKCEFKEPKKIVLAVDKDESLMKLVYQPLVKLAEHFNSEVVVLHVAKNMNDVDKRNYENLESYLENVRHRLITIYDEDIRDGVDGFSRAYQADVLAIVNQKLGFFQRMFHKSISRKLALHTSIPLLVMSHQK